MKHFENLWDDAEKIKGQSDRDEISAKIKKLLDTYTGIHRSGGGTHIGYPVGFTEAAKQKAMGDILFLLANLSAMDTIDVYKALSEAIERADIRSLGVPDEKHKSIDS